MGKFGYENQVAIRSTGEVILALDRVVAALRASGRLRFRGRKITKEAVVNSTFLWLEDRGTEEVERILGEYIPRLEAMLGDGPATRQDESSLKVGPAKAGGVGQSLNPRTGKPLAKNGRKDGAR